MAEGVERPEKDLLAFELRSAPDAEDLRTVLESVTEKGVADTPDASVKINNPRTLRAALCFLGANASKDQIFDQLWRLCMSLRYWRGGADRHWIRNPRNARRSSSSLNWHQYLEPT